MGDAPTQTDQNTVHGVQAHEVHVLVVAKSKSDGAMHARGLHVFYDSLISNDYGSA